jgi:hypothetical protein
MKAGGANVLGQLLMEVREGLVGLVLQLEAARWRPHALSRPDIAGITNTDGLVHASAGWAGLGLNMRTACLPLLTIQQHTPPHVLTALSSRAFFFCQSRLHA